MSLALSLELYNLNVVKIKTSIESNRVVTLQTELLKVAIIEHLEDRDSFIKNYESEIDYRLLKK